MRIISKNVSGFSERSSVMSRFSVWADFLLRPVYINTDQGFRVCRMEDL